MPPSTEATKDKVENALKRQVCHGKLGLRAAQHLIRTNWTFGLKYVTGNTLPALNAAH